MYLIKTAVDVKSKLQARFFKSPSGAGPEQQDKFIDKITTVSTYICISHVSI